MKKNPLRQIGFTLIELLVVMAIIGTLLTLALPRYIHSIDRAKEVALRRDLQVIRDSINAYHEDNGVYPDSLDALVKTKYLRHFPIDPIAEKTTSWVFEYANAPASGLKNIRSGAKGVAANGTPYKDF